MDRTSKPTNLPSGKTGPMGPVKKVAAVGMSYRKGDGPQPKETMKRMGNMGGGSMESGRGKK